MLMQKVRNSRWRYIDRVIDKSFTKNKVISAIQSVLSMLIVSEESFFLGDLHQALTEEKTQSYGHFPGVGAQPHSMAFGSVFPNITSAIHD